MVFPGISALKTNNVGADEQGGTLGASGPQKPWRVLFLLVYLVHSGIYSSEAPWVVYALASGATIIGLSYHMCA